MKKLGFGLMRLPTTDKEDGGSIDMPQMERMVDAFLERGFTYFDTAYMYHDHQSEIAAREALVKRHPRDSFTLATKLPIFSLKEEGDQERIFEEQRQKCGVEFFDYYLLHAMNRNVYESAVKKFDSFGFCERLREEGKIRHFGFSYHDNAEFLDELLTEHPEVEFVQLQINYLDWNSPNVQSGACYDVCVKHGKKVVVMEPVKGGALANLPETAAKLLRDADSKASAASWAIRFAASLPNVMTVLSGMSNVEQMEDNLCTMEHFTPLTEADKALLDRTVEALQSFITVPCTACRYCVEGCPMGIPIPELFALYNVEKRNKRLHMGGSKRDEYKALTETKGKASDCVQCRSCEGVCPQHLEISELLKDVFEVLEKERAQ